MHVSTRAGRDLNTPMTQGRANRQPDDGARPVIQHDWGATCWRPEVKGLNLAINTIYNHWRFEDVWIDR